MRSGFWKGPSQVRLDIIGDLIDFSGLREIVAIRGNAHDFISHSQGEENFCKIGFQGDDPLVGEGRKRKKKQAPYEERLEDSRKPGIFW